MRVECWRGAFDLEPGVINDDARIVFTKGRCVDMAKAIHERTGWQLAVACEHDYGSRYKYNGVHRLGDHVVCIAPDGRIADVDGVRSFEEWSEDWPQLPDLRPVAYKTVQNLGWFPQNIKDARPFVDAVLEGA